MTNQEKAINAIKKLQADNKKIEVIKKLQSDNKRLKQICRDTYEVWAGSEIGAPIYASEAYAIMIIKNMVEEVSKGLKL